LVGFLWFEQVTDVWTWVGAGVIAGSSIYVAYREARVARLTRPGEMRAAGSSWR
jgi:drug/metabolite transporter (DMT)-like permease